MSLWAPFVGGTYQVLAPIVAADQAVNVYLETSEVEGAAKQKTLYGTPGLELEATVGTTGCRGWFHQDGRTWVTVGATLYERTAAGTYGSRGTILDDGGRVSYASNGQGGDQLGIVGGGELKVLDLTTDTLSDAITLPFTGPVMLAFIDGYGLINQADSPIVWFSSLEDLTMWDALDFFARSGTADNIVGITVTRDRVWVLGTETTTLFYDSGDADTPFLPYPGTTIQMGLVTPQALTVYQDIVHWIAQTANGQRRVVRATDPSAQRFSTPPIDLFLSRCTSLADAELDVYEQAGHPFVVMTCPSSPDAIQTYAYDLRESLWHARASLAAASGAYVRWRVRGITVADGTVLAGDAATGDLYTLDLGVYDENGAILKRERTAPYLANEAQWLFLDQFELGIQAGVGLALGQGVAPVAQLEISRDGAETWVSAGTALLGAMGAYTARTIWRRLGRARSDRLVLRVTQTDPVQTVWTGAWLRATAGTGEL